MMTSHKPLKDVAHDFGHSFVSLMNYIDDVYFLGHLLKQVRATNSSRLEVDLLRGTAKPEQLLNLFLNKESVAFRAVFGARNFGH